MKRTLLALILALLTTGLAHAQQEEVQYTKEIGAGLGLGFMTGDLSTRWYNPARPNADLLMRFILSPRMAIKTELGYNALKGSTDGVHDFYPAQLGQGATTTPLQYSMTGNMVDLNVLYELHFLPYGWLRNYLGHKRITPYVQMGLGMLFAHTSGLRNGQEESHNAFNIDIPIGLGLKWKASRRLNVGLDWTFHFTPSDRLDGLSSPSGIKVSGFHGKDFYSKTLITLTYDISPKCPTCNKAE